MAKYFNDTLFYWVSKFVNDKKNERLTEAGHHVYRMLLNFTFKDIVVEDGYLVIRKCDNMRNVAFSDSELNEVAIELAEEFKNLFGLEATVEYKLAYTESVEPDPIPPLYWGEKDTDNYYSLVIKAKLPE